jgi:uncharacterized membrane protein YgcG
MNTFQSNMTRVRAVSRLWAFLLLVTLMLAAAPRELLAQTSPAAEPPPVPTYTPQSPEQLQQLVAPIALYPDSLVAQILAAATFPEQIVEADRWLQANPGMSGTALAQAANQQSWDASVKALTAFPAVLGNMDRNLSWTSSLGDAYYNQPQDVMAAVQTMRQRAQAAGNLQTTAQQTVSTQGADIDIEPTNPDLVYVPAYDPWLVYGAPIIAWPGWYAYPGIWFGGPYLSFGVGIPIGFFAGFAWGWPHWGFDWRHHFVRFNQGEYFSHSVTFFNRNNFYRGNGARGEFRPGEARPGEARPGEPRPGEIRPDAAGRITAAPPRPFGGDDQAARGYGAPSGQAGVRSGAFGGFGGGGEARGFAARGGASFGGGGFRGGGGAPRGGGGRH